MKRLLLVTGATRGLGFAIAERLSGPETHTLAVGRTVGGLEDLDDRIAAKGGEATLVPMDITDDPALDRLGAAIQDRWRKLDLWVHSAVHATPLSPVSHVAEKDFDRAMAVNARALQRLIVVTEPLLRASEHGRAILLDDDPGPASFFSTYRATKLAARAIGEAWAAECSRLGPEVHLHRPAPMPTAMRSRFYPGQTGDDLASPTEEAERMVDALGLDSFGVAPDQAPAT